jgi:hypothetical protein
MDPRGQVSLGVSGTGAAAVSDAYGFVEKQQAKDDLRSRQMDQDLRKIKAANNKLGDKALGAIAKTDLPYWNHQSTRDIRKSLRDFRAKTMEMYKGGVNPYDDQGWVSAEQDLQDIVLMEGDHKEKYGSVISVLQGDYKKGEDAAYDYEKSKAAIEGYADATHAEREKMDPFKLLVPKEPVYSQDDFFSEVSPKDIKITNDNPQSKTVVSKPNREAMTAEATTKASTPKGQAVLEQGIKKGWWKDEDDMIAQSVDNAAKQINKDSQTTKKKNAPPRYVNGGKTTKDFVKAASFDVPITNSKGKNYTSPVTMSTGELNITIPDGAVVDSKTGRKLNVSESTDDEGKKYKTGAIAGNIKLAGGILVYTDDFKIMWKGTGLKEGSSAEGYRADVMVDPKYIPSQSVKDQVEAMELYLKEIDTPATADEM